MCSYGMAQGVMRAAPGHPVQPQRPPACARAPAKGPRERQRAAMSAESITLTRLIQDT